MSGAASLAGVRCGIVRFPGSNCDADTLRVFSAVVGVDAYYIWHADTSLNQADLVVIPGGFAYGDYLRCGAIARFAPAMAAVQDFARAGGPVLGICNGFQVLCEAHLLPGALVRNASCRFAGRQVHVRVENASTRFTGRYREGQVLQMPVAHGEGCYVCDADTLAHLEETGRVVFRYVDRDGNRATGANPNGSLDDIAGIVNDRGNVLGLMPHPERAAERILGSEDGLGLLRSAAESALLAAA